MPGVRTDFVFIKEYIRNNSIYSKHNYVISYMLHFGQVLLVKSSCNSTGYRIGCCTKTMHNYDQIMVIERSLVRKRV